MAGLFLVFVYGSMRQTSPTGSLVQVRDNQVAVIQDGLSGSQRTVLAPGYQVILPHVETVHALDKSPVELVMAGNAFVDPNHVPLLTVRSRDGSHFWFERVAIQYGLDPLQLDRVLQDSGPGDGFKNGLLKAYARSILRDELGRFSPEEVVAPDNIQSATRAALGRLDQGMKQHGLTVFEIAISKPSFDRRYEDTIERRKVAEQEIGSLEREAELLEGGKETRQAEIRGEHELALRKGQAEWAHELARLEMEAERLRLGQADELANLQGYLDLALKKGRDDWKVELDALAREGQALADGQAERLAEKRREHELKLLAAGAQWERELAALVRGEGELRALQEARLETIRSEHAQRREEMLAQLAVEIGAAREVAVASVSEARRNAASALLAARVGRDQKVALAQVAGERYRAEAEALAAETRLLAQSGESAVRAALVARLASIVFEILPFTPPAPESAPEARKAAARAVRDNKPRTP